MAASAAAAQTAADEAKVVFKDGQTEILTILNAFTDMVKQKMERHNQCIEGMTTAVANEIATAKKAGLHSCFYIFVSVVCSCVFVVGL